MSANNEIYLEKKELLRGWQVAMISLGVLLVLAGMLYGLYVLVGPKFGGLMVLSTVGMALSFLGGVTLPRLYRELEDVRFLFAAFGCLLVAAGLLACGLVVAMPNISLQM